MGKVTLSVSIFIFIFFFNSISISTGFFAMPISWESSTNFVLVLRAWSALVWKRELIKLLLNLMIVSMSIFCSAQACSAL